MWPHLAVRRTAGATIARHRGCDSTSNDPPPAALDSGVLSARFVPFRSATPRVVARFVERRDAASARSTICTIGNHEMDVLSLNRRAWNHIGAMVASPYLENETFSGMFDRFCRMLPSTAAVLDLGCGPGSPPTRELVGRGFRVTGIDISETMIEKARQRVPEATFIHASVTDIGFVEQFDGVLSSYSMLCLDPLNFAIAAERAVAALKQDGVLLLALNEGRPGADEPRTCSMILGETMYSRPYSEEEIRTVFSSLGMVVRLVERAIVRSEAYGEERTLIVLMQKNNG
jgi:SAM-dependent methyltransferase